MKRRWTSDKINVVENTTNHNKGGTSSMYNSIQHFLKYGTKKIENNIKNLTANSESLRVKLTFSHYYSIINYKEKTKLSKLNTTCASSISHFL